MYNPPHFREDRREVLCELIKQHSLASLVTLGPDGLDANHLPLILDPEPGPWGTLRGHMSRTNPQWRGFRRDVDALAIFQGPSVYVTPSWYPSKEETGKVVPTYNYAVVHARGPMNIVEEPEKLERHLHALTALHEARFDQPWEVSDAPPEFIRAIMNGIVGIEMRIVSLEGKWKMSQNRTSADRAGAIRGLRERGDPLSVEVADEIESRLDSAK
jgi:transcriptional regulator